MSFLAPTNEQFWDDIRSQIIRNNFRYSMPRFVLPMFALFWTMDIVSYPLLKWKFLSIRLFVLFLFTILIYSERFVKTHEGLNRLAMLTTFIAASAMNAMIYFSKEGFFSVYYVGLSMVCSAGFAIFPMDRLSVLLTALGTIIPYFAVCILSTQGDLPIREMTQVGFTLGYFSFLALVISNMDFNTIAYLKRERKKNKAMVMDITSLCKQITDYEQHKEKNYQFFSRHSAEVSSIVHRLNSLTERLKDLTKKSEEHAKYRGIAMTVNMLAHDVRRPFSMMRIILEMLKTSPKNGADLVTKYEPFVGNAIASVDSMVNDILEISSEKDLQCQNISLESVIEMALKNVFSFEKNSDITFTYNLLPDIYAFIDKEKFGRVMTNLVANALQAMKGKGNIDFSSRLNGEFLDIVVENTNSYITPEKLPFIFDEFYTSAKSGGTGLGLAIVRKIVGKHQGTVSCVSVAYPNTKTSFVIHLPKRLVFHSKLEEITKLPAHSKDIFCQEEQDFKEDIELSTNLKVLLVDDEPIYNEMFRTIVAKNSNFRKNVELVIQTDILIPDEIDSIDLIIIDVDFCKAKNGFDLLNEIRSKTSKPVICMHSNRVSPEYHGYSASLGAEFYLIKPMTSDLFAKLLSYVETRKIGGKKNSLLS